jgi:hypothetical protein
MFFLKKGARKTAKNNARKHPKKGAPPLPHNCLNTLA